MPTFLLAVEHKIQYCLIKQTKEQIGLPWATTLGKQHLSQANPSNTTQ